MKAIKDFTDIDYAIIERGAMGGTLKETLQWVAGGLTPVKTETAFQLARGGGAVFAIYDDGTDSQLDDIESEEQYYPDKSKSYPEVPTIFVVEGEL